MVFCTFQRKWTSQCPLKNADLYEPILYINHCLFNDVLLRWVSTKGSPPARCDDEDTLSADKSEEGTTGSFSRLTHAAEALASQVWFPAYCGVLLEVGWCLLFWDDQWLVSCYKASQFKRRYTRLLGMYLISLVIPYTPVDGDIH